MICEILSRNQNEIEFVIYMLCLIQFIIIILANCLFNFSINDFKLEGPINCGCIFRKCCFFDGKEYFDL